MQSVSVPTLIAGRCRFRHRPAGELLVLGTIDESALLEAEAV